MGSANTIDIFNKIIFRYPCESTLKCAPYEIHLSPGRYRIELWGSQGGDSRDDTTPDVRQNTGGKGAYTRGDIDIKNDSIFYLYLGAKGEDLASTAANARAKGGWNGGGDGGIDTYDSDYPESSAGGGGAVDIRLIYYDINEVSDPSKFNRSAFIESMKSRIMVAGSGGGSCADKHYNDTYMTPYGGPGGGLEARDVLNFTLGGTQVRGELGIGANGKSYGEASTLGGGGGSSGGAGAGYRGGIDQTVFSKEYFVSASAAGGSSYISGHRGCKSPVPGNDDTTSSVDDYIHHSRMFFVNTLMIDGSKRMPSTYAEDSIGHSGNGVAAITVFNSQILDAICDKCQTLDPSVYHIQFCITFGIFTISPYD